MTGTVAARESHPGAPGLGDAVDRNTDGSAGRVAVLTTVDQVLSSASNALMVFAIAHVTSVDEFGVTALMVTAGTVWTGFNRGALGTPLLLTSNLTPKEIAVESGYAFSWALLSGVAAGALTFASGLAFNEAWIGLAFALSLPMVLAQDVLRVTTIALGHPGRAAVADALWTALMALLFVVNLTNIVELRADVTIYLWGFGGLVSTLLLASWAGVRPRASRIGRWWSRYSTARIRFGSSYAVAQIGAVLVTFTAVIIVGGAAAAAIRGATTLFGPISMLIAAMPMVFVPHAARTGNAPDRQWRLLKMTAAATSGLTLVAAGILIALPDRWGAVLLGPTWKETSTILLYIGIEWAAICWLGSSYIFFQSQGDSASVIKLNLSYLAIQLGGCIAAGLLFRTAIAFGVALALSGCVMAGVGAYTVRRHLRTHAEALTGAVGGRGKP